jgi:hypothetical protein
MSRSGWGRGPLMPTRKTPRSLARAIVRVLRMVGVTGSAGKLVRRQHGSRRYSTLRRGTALPAGQHSHPLHSSWRLDGDSSPCAGCRYRPRGGPRARGWWLVPLLLPGRLKGRTACGCGGYHFLASIPPGPSQRGPGPVQRDQVCATALAHAVVAGARLAALNAMPAGAGTGWLFKYRYDGEPPATPRIEGNPCVSTATRTCLTCHNVTISIVFLLLAQAWRALSCPGIHSRR